AGVSLAADTLYMRNGDQVQGRLVSVRNGEIEFRQDSGQSARTIRVDIADVRRIEFDDQYSGGSYNDDPGWNNDNTGTNNTNYDRPSGMRERSVVVSADVPSVDSGIDVRSGQTVYFRASGQVRWGPNRKDGPQGEKNSPENLNRPMPNRPAAALIGRVGSYSTDYFFIGNEQGAIRVRSSGRLFLGINDDVLDDNSGNFRVIVYY
ncbi:MAG: hypothetical protein NTY02_18200, partial [Acidobacteria bacterium]|nr:hypothetical protein [Acidobacteriota bacterium]